MVEDLKSLLQGQELVLTALDLDWVAEEAEWIKKAAWAALFSCLPPLRLHSSVVYLQFLVFASRGISELNSGHDHFGCV